MKRFAIAFKEGSDNKICFDEAIKSIENQIEQKIPKLVIFTSEVDNFVYYSDMLHEKYPQSEVIGVTTCAHVNSCGRGVTGLSVMAIAEGIEVATGEILEIGKCPIRYSDRVREAASKLTNKENCVCLEFTSAFCNSEELVLDTLKKQLNPYGIPVFGSSGGSDEDEEINFVALNGKIYYEGCVFAIIHNENGRIGLFKENLYRPTIYRFTATDVDSEERRVYELNDEPAINVMAAALKIPTEELMDKFENYPLGRILGDEIYITEPDKVFDDGSMTYLARIYNYTDLVVLELDDYEKVKVRTEKTLKDSGIKPDFSIVVNCIGRIELFEKMGLLDTHQKSLNGMLGEYIGVSGFGEQLNYEQINETMIICVFE